MSQERCLQWCGFRWRKRIRTRWLSCKAGAKQGKDLSWWDWSYPVVTVRWKCWLLLRCLPRTSVYEIFERKWPTVAWACLLCTIRRADIGHLGPCWWTGWLSIAALVKTAHMGPRRGSQACSEHGYAWEHCQKVWIAWPGTKQLLLCRNISSGGMKWLDSVHSHHLFIDRIRF